MKILTAAVTAIGLMTVPLAATAGPKGCPPGLAKKHNGCNPPGQAKKMHRDDHRRDHDEAEYRDHDRDRDHDEAEYRDHDRDHDRDVTIYHRGDVFRGDYIVVDDYDRYGLHRPGDDSAYWRAGEQIFRVDPQTQEILDIIRLADLVLN